MKMKIMLLITINLIQCNTFSFLISILLKAKL